MNIYAFKNTAGDQPKASDYLFKLKQPMIKVDDDDDGKGGKGEKKRRFEGVGYTGDPINQHPYWGTVVFDLSKMKVPKKMPILLNHYTDRIVGFSDRYEISDKGLELEGHLTRSTSFGQEVIALSDEGFPWQMSVRIHPSTIEEIKAGASATVNGRTINGPAYIFRDSKIVETSFSPTGWDDGTSATALSRVNSDEEDTQMSKELEDKVKALETQLADLAASNTALVAEKEELQKQIDAFSKQALEVKKTEIKDAFSKAGQELSDENLEKFSNMPSDVLQLMFAAMAKPAEKKEEPKPELQMLPDGLFAHQAKEGKTEDTSAAEGKGLLSLCANANEQFSKSYK